MEGITPIVGTTHANEHLLGLYFQSLSWMKRELGDCLIIPGHGEPIEHVAPVIDQIVYSYLKKMDQVKDAVVKDKRRRQYGRRQNWFTGSRRFQKTERILS